MCKELLPRLLAQPPTLNLNTQKHSITIFDQTRTVHHTADGGQNELQGSIQHLQLVCAVHPSD